MSDVDVFPASFGQERLWFLEQLEPELALYGINARFPLPGRIDPERLTSALGEVVARHEALRTSLVVAGEELTQVISARVPVTVARTDLSGVAAGERWAAFEAVCLADAVVPLALDRPPLWRARLVRLADDEWWLVFVVHHTLFDATSAGIFLRELREAYAAREQGREPRLAELGIQYADYAAWQRGRWSGGQFDAQLAYWRDRLRGAPAELGQPTDRPRPAVATYEGAVLEVVWSKPLTDAVSGLAQQGGATLFMALLAGLAAVLARWSGQGEVVIGSLVSGRDMPETEPLIGMFVNTLNLRVDVTGEPTFRELLDRTRAVVLEALERADVPFEKVVEALQPERHLSRAPLHQVELNLLPPGPGRQFRNGTAKLDLFVDAGLTDDGRLEFRVDYSTDLYDAATVRRLMDGFELLLAGAVAGPDRPVSRLGLLTDADRAVVAAANETSRDVPPGCLHEVVAQRAARTPDGPAVVTPGAAAVTYAELEERATAVAGRLQARGVGRGDRVGVCLERGADLVAALLGVVKAGAAYVPLDPDHPRERLGFVLADAGARMVVTRAGLVDRLPETADAPGAPAVLLVEDVSADDVGGFRAPPVHPDESAYVIYTSGSTGRPKGVEVPHRAVVNLVADVGRAPGLGPGDGFLFLTSMSFDIAALEVFGPLVAGGTVVAVPERAVQAAPVVRRAVEDGLVTVVQATPSVLGLLVPQLPPGSVRWVISGGEPLPVGLAARALEVAGELWNFYGPTETTIWSCRFRVPDGVEAMSIGGPVANTAAHVLGPGMVPVPVGVAGELCLGGAGVARGYRGRPGLTADRFVPDPFGPPGGRLYRTGDRARWRADGTLAYLGRQDDQVKVRGVRVEPGEIEAALAGHPDVTRAVVALRDDAPGGPGLVAYVLWAGEAGQVAGLRGFLRERLPEEMVPAAFVAVDGFPVAPGGKLDRAALPAPDAAAVTPEAPTVAPATPTEELLCGLWQELLGRDRVGVDDNFFDLGGHSLTMVALQARLVEPVGREVPILDLFRYPTVRALAGHLDGDGDGAGSEVERGERRAARRRQRQGRRRDALRSGDRT